MTSEFAVFIHLPEQRDAVPAGLLRMTEQGSQVLRSVFGYIAFPREDDCR